MAIELVGKEEKDQPPRDHAAQVVEDLGHHSWTPGRGLELDPVGEQAQEGDSHLTQ